jgi:hypothetical protein
MGATQANPDREMLIDYATKEHKLRLHLDILMTPEQFARINALMQKDERQAVETLRAEVPKDVHPFLDLFFRNC